MNKEFQKFLSGGMNLQLFASSAQQVGKYNAKDVNVVVNNTLVTGFGDSDINCSKDEDNIENTVGIQGDVTKNVHNHPLGTIVLPILATSRSRPYMDALANDPDSFFSIWVVSKNQPYETTGGNKASVMKQADRVYGQNVNVREYTIAVYDYVTQGAGA